MLNHMHLPEVASTNETLSFMINEVDFDGFVLQTDFQTKGKGQAGNFWESEANKNLLFSMALFPEFLPPADQFLISKAISIGLVEALNHFHPGFEIKWPNDIYYQDKKVAGILIETAIMGNHLKHAIVGIGLNVNQTEFKSAPNPTSLSLITGQAFQLNAILELIQEYLLKYYHYLKDGDQALINQSYCAHLYRKKGEWTFKENDRTFKASIEKVLPSGQLVLATSEGEEKEYWMKEVEFVI